MLSQRATTIAGPWARSVRARELVGSHSQLGVLLALLIGYLGISFRNLTSTPIVHQDEPWIASTGWKLAIDGRLGSDMFTGFYGMEDHYYEFMPVHPILLALTFRLAGVGLLQARAASVVIGLLVLLLTYLLGRRLFGATVGLLAVALLLLVPTVSTADERVTGIILLDAARLARYDIVVPFLGLVSLHAYLSASDRRDARWFLLAGLLAGLAGLSHLYGAFWIAALALLAIWTGQGWRHLVALALGFSLPWLIYAAFVLAHPNDWLGQLRLDESRFNLFDPAWYLDNLARERLRYDPGIGPPSSAWLLKPGFWLSLIALPVCLIGLARRSVVDRVGATRALLVPTIVLSVLFALLIEMKRPIYLATIVPLLALTIAWGVVEGWRWACRRRWRPALRLAIVLVGLVVAIQGLSSITAIERRQPAGDYTALTQQIRQEVPPGTRVLGMHNYWFGLEDREYRSWFVPIVQTEARYWSPPLSIEQALDRIAPDAVLIDPRVSEFLVPHPTINQAVHAWLRDHGLVLTRVIEDRTYGRIEIYRRPV